MFFLILVVLLLIGGGVTLVVVQNFAQLVHLYIFSWQSPSLSLGWVLMLAFLLGVLLLYTTAVLSAYGDRKTIRELQQRILVLEEAQVTSSKQENVSSLEPTMGDWSSSNAGSLIPMPGINLPQAGGGGRRIPTSPLPPPQNFRQ